MLTLYLSIVLSAVFIPRILHVSYKKKLFDYASARKVHTGNIPRLGGLSFLPIVLIATTFIAAIYLLSGYSFTTGFQKVLPQLCFFVAGAFLLYLVGVKDDLGGLRYRLKFVVQFIVASLLPVSGLWLKNLNGLFGIYALSPWIGIPITILLIVLIINAMNFIDGIDGLAAGLSIVSLVVMGVLFFVAQMWIYAIISLATIGTLIPFLYYNMYGKAEKHKKIFMGDTGSLTLGYVLAFLSLSLSVNAPISALSIGGIPIYLVAFSTLFVPMFDVVRVMFIRLSHHHNPFLPDKSHIHHMLLAKGYTIRKSMTTILVVAYFYGVLNIFSVSKGWNINLIVLVNVALWIAFSVWLAKGQHTLSNAMENKGTTRIKRAS